MMPSIHIGRTISREEKPFVIAELSANHLGRLDRALAIIDAAAAAGCDAVKLPDVHTRVDDARVVDG